MARSCPPGVLCIENMTLLIVVLIVFAVVYFLGMRQYKIDNRSPNVEKIIYKERRQNSDDLFAYPAYGYSNNLGDVLLNPHQPPLRDNSYHPKLAGDIRGIPINLSTQGQETSYRQVGILTKNGNDENIILPLMGRPLLTNRDKWNFYTMSDKNNMIKLPITNKGRSCTNEYGCDNLYNGDTVYVEGYNDTFVVTVYDNAVMKYIPYI